MKLAPRVAGESTIDQASLVAAPKVFANEISLNATTDEVAIVFCIRGDIMCHEEPAKCFAQAIVHLAPLQAIALHRKLEEALDEMSKAWDSMQAEVDGKRKPRASKKVK